MIATLRCGIQPAAQDALANLSPQTTLSQAIEDLMRKSEDQEVNARLRAALADPLSVIEIRSGKQVQTATLDMPLCELVSPAGEPFEITVSQPHAGG